MSDVIWAAIIAVVGSGVGSAIGARVTYLVSSRQAATTIATVERNAEVELAKVEGELEKLRREYREAERSNRQGTYHRMLAVLDRMHMFATGYNPEGETDYMEALETFNNMVGGIHLFGAESVRQALAPLAEEMSRLGEQIRALQHEHRTMPYAVAYGMAYRARASEFAAATMHLIQAMRADVTREILDDPADDAHTSDSPSE